MAINETGAIFKGFTFDGIDSKDYGVYISGDAVFNAPERDVEMIDIPGRNGSYALDKGRFANITVTYPAGLFGDTEADFAQGISDLRNALASRKGYCRLEDEYNPNEYRMAIYRSGLDVEPASLKSGEFDIVFDCKPQRFLKSGETAVEVTSGGTINNPTLFESKPVLQVYGYGNIGINGENISVSNVPIGRVILANAEQTSDTCYTGDVVTYLLSNTESLDAGDQIYASYRDGIYTVGYGLRSSMCAVTLDGYTTVTGWKNNTSEHPFELEYGTPHTYTIMSDTMPYEIMRISDSQTFSGYMKYRIYIAYDGDRTITVTPNYVGTTISEGISPTGLAFRFDHSTVYGDSTISALGNPLFIDLDIGEAYKEENGVLISSNAGVSLPAELPVLKPGANEIQFDNTVTQLKIAPRWWGV